MNPGADGDPEVPPEQGGEPLEILDHDGLVQAELPAHGLNHLLGGPFAPDDRQGGVSRQDHAQSKGNEGDHEEGDQCLENASDDESSHGYTFRVSCLGSRMIRSQSPRTLKDTTVR